VVRLLNQRYIPLKVDAMAPSNRPLIQSLGIQGYPTLIAAAADGRVVMRQEGFIGPNQALTLLSQALHQASPRGSQR